MADAPSVKTVETEDEFVHVRFRDPDDFDTIRTPDWAAKAAQDVSEGAEVRTGKRKDGTTGRSRASSSRRAWARTKPASRPNRSSRRSSRRLPVRGRPPSSNAIQGFSLAATRLWSGLRKLTSARAASTIVAVCSGYGTRTGSLHPLRHVHA